VIAARSSPRRTQCLGGREIEDEIEFGQLLDWDVAGLEIAPRNGNQPGIVIVVLLGVRRECIEQTPERGVGQPLVIEPAE
jgi:hypothetical protein